MNLLQKIKKFIHNLTRNPDVVQYTVKEVPKEPIPHQNKEETKLDTQIENVYVSQVRDWAVRKIELLHEADRHRNAKALLAEFDEWINIPDGVDELDYICLENDGLVDDSEIDQSA